MTWVTNSTTMENKILNLIDNLKQVSLIRFEVTQK